jgi:hypothetical protein
MKIENFLDKEGKTALDEVKATINPLWQPGRNSDWQPPELDQRMTWALSKIDSKYVVTILADQKDSIASNKAKELEAKYPGSIVWTSTGQAQSSYPGADCLSHATSREIRPGVSIGHGRFRAGTLGCLVKVRETNKAEYKGVVSAAHVIALNDSVEPEDLIYSPGKPDVGQALKRSDAIGRLQDTTDLFPVHKVDPAAQDIYHSIDIAIVNLEKAPIQRPIPKYNEVPDPADPDKRMIKVKSVIKEENLPMELNKNVYKFGRTTGFTEGQLVHVMIMHRQLKLPNNKLYLYKELFAVKSTKKGSSFSRAGDSGAMVYTANGHLVGFVVGADDEITLCCAAERSLNIMNASLLGA